MYSQVRYTDHVPVCLTTCLTARRGSRGVARRGREYDRGERVTLPPYLGTLGTYLTPYVYSRTP